jgi:hypothetical protein
MAKRFVEGTPEFLYSSAEIVLFASHFVDLREEVFRLCDRLEGKAPAVSSRNK